MRRVIGMMALAALAAVAGGCGGSDGNEEISAEAIGSTLIEDQLPRAETSTSVITAPLPTATVATVPATTAATAPPTTRATAITAAQSGCHPSYRPCVPADVSDVDCEGGSGNGPAYTGRVEVVGPDEYDLDRDGDGVGCE